MYNFDGITRADCQSILMNLIDLHDTAGVYIVDSHQQVIHWGMQMEKMTGLSSAQAIGKPCPKILAIKEQSGNKNTLLDLSNTDGQTVAVLNHTHLMHDDSGEFAGGLGIIQHQKDQSTNNVIEKRKINPSQNFHSILSRSPTMQPVFQLIENAATTDVTVLVRGESGSGKELVAKAIHDLSTRSHAPFLAINCAALSSNLLESELFGHVRGAFTGATKDHHGLFKRAHGGTLFLDEVAELPLDLQAKLLRVVQERNYIPVGGDQAIDVDVRIVAATHRSLREEVKKGQFREDLMFRLRVVPIFIPPLRDRREDIYLLLWHFIQQHNNNDNFRRIEKIEPQAMRVLMDYHWPGNIRELQNVVEYAFVVCQGVEVTLSDLPPEFRETQSELKVTQEKLFMSAEDEKTAIQQALEQTNGKVTFAAELLGMSRATFWRKRKLYEI